MATLVVISKHWARPQISVEVTKEQLNISMELHEFLRALAQEIGNPSLLLTQARLKDKLIEAAVIVEAKMKESSVPAMVLAAPLE